MNKDQKQAEDWKEALKKIGEELEEKEPKQEPIKPRNENNTKGS